MPGNGASCVPPNPASNAGDGKGMSFLEELKSKQNKGSKSKPSTKRYGGKGVIE
jgi:hypothetical protein